MRPCPKCGFLHSKGYGRNGNLCACCDWQKLCMQCGMELERGKCPDCDKVINGMERRR